MSRPALAQLQLHLSPPPRNISESRLILRALEQFGNILMFKVLRFEDTTKNLTPRAHIIFKSVTSADSLLSAGPIQIPSTGITVTPSETIFQHHKYIEFISASHIITDGSMFGRRKVREDNIGVEIEDTTPRFGDDGTMTPSTQSRAMRSRMLRRYTGGFAGFKDLEERMAKKEKLRVEKEEREKTKRRRSENERLARGEEVDLSEKTEEALREDQLGTIQDLLGELGEGEKEEGEKGEEEEEGEKKEAES